MKSLVLVLLVLKSIAGSAVPRDRPLVSTPKGQIRGVRAEDGNYDAYYGIPYALVDEENPFEPSTPHPDFADIFEADINDVKCIQASNGDVTGVIQCLQLDVYVPNTPTTSEPMVVMIYVHGGAFITGHKAELSPRFLVKHDVIVVAINYRLGLHGFLCTSESRLKNTGLKDQAMAFNWVRDNIAAFGGDANQITIFGMSAGAISIDYHMLATARIAQRVILMSGTALTTWVLAEENDDIPINIAKELGFSFDSAIGAIELLSTADPAKVVAIADKLHYLANEDGYPVAMPCVSKSDLIMLTDYPVNLQPKVRGMDIMIGTTNKEVMFMYPNADNLDFYRNYSFDTELLYEFEEPHSVDTVRQFYIGDEQPNENLQDAILDYASDLSFVHSAERTVDKYLNSGAKSVYRYLFSYEGDRNLAKMGLGLTAKGACHGDDLGYLFDLPVLAGVPITEADQTIIDAMTKIWTDFAKFGNPTPQPSDLIPDWDPVEGNQRPYMNIGSPIRLESRVFNDRMAFWDVYYKLHGHKVRGYGPSGGQEDIQDDYEDDYDDDYYNGASNIVPLTLISITTLVITLFLFR